MMGDVLAGVLQHYILTQGGDTPSIVCARGGAEKHVRAAHNAEKERNSLFWILLDHSDTE